MTTQAAIRIFWVKLITVVLLLGAVIGYFGYKQAKPPAYVTLSNMVLKNQVLADQVDRNTQHLGELDNRISRLEQTNRNEPLGAVKK